jgi:hypothetical protein
MANTNGNRSSATTRKISCSHRLLKRHYVAIEEFSRRIGATVEEVIDSVLDEAVTNQISVRNKEYREGAKKATRASARQKEIDDTIAYLDFDV